MCNQAVGLVGAELERQGIATVAIQLLRFVAERVRPPRALCLPFPHRSPLAPPPPPLCFPPPPAPRGGPPADASLQHAVIESALRMLEDPALTPPALVD